jgi:hypothetical protein
MRNLKTYFWSLVARELTKFRAIGETQTKAWFPLLQYAKGKPYHSIDDYMKRWWLIRHYARKGEPGHGTFRNWLRLLYPFYARFHLILRADSERHPHNHPFAFTSMIMSGWYTEEITDSEGNVSTKTYCVGDINYKPEAGVYHRITKVAPEGVLTLVVMGHRTGNSWGFLVNGEHVHWENYLNYEAVVSSELLVEYES